MAVPLYPDGNVTIEPFADDKVLKIGNTGATQYSMDIKWEGNGASGADTVLFDASGNIVQFDGVDLQLKDSDILEFGDATGGDVYVRWDATDLDFLAAADNTVIKFGNSTNTFDIHFLGSTAGARVVWDSSLNVLKLNASAQNARTYLNMGTLVTAPTTGVAIGDMFIKRTGTAYRLGIIVTGTVKKYTKFSLTVGG
jgi:hypothetical protein